jgi:hypothetical protein
MKGDLVIVELRSTFVYFYIAAMSLIAFHYETQEEDSLCFTSLV